MIIFVVVVVVVIVIVAAFPVAASFQPTAMSQQRTQSSKSSHIPILPTAAKNNRVIRVSVRNFM
jgi:hypothetical protein